MINFIYFNIFCNKENSTQIKPLHNVVITCTLTAQFTVICSVMSNITLYSVLIRNYPMTAQYILHNRHVSGDVNTYVTISACSCGLTKRIFNYLYIGQTLDFLIS